MFLSEAGRRIVSSSPWLHPRVRQRLLRAIGVRLGRGTFLSPPAVFKGKDVTTGSGCYINSGVYVGRGSLSLGSNVAVGPGVTFVTDTHEFGPSARRAGKNIKQPIVVGDGVWIGASAVILGNVTIAPGCVIGAGTLVTKDTEPDGLYLGTPARRVRDLPAAGE